MSVCLLIYFKNTSKFHHIFCTCYLWLWLSPGGSQYAEDDVMFSHNGANGQNQSMFCPVCQVAAPVGTSRLRCLVEIARWRQWGRSLSSLSASCLEMCIYTRFVNKKQQWCRWLDLYHMATWQTRNSWTVAMYIMFIVHSWPAFCHAANKRRLTDWLNISWLYHELQ